MQKRVKQWYYNVDGKLYLEVRYGNKALELAKGKAAIEVGSDSKLSGGAGYSIEAVQPVSLATCWWLLSAWLHSCA